MTPQASSWIAEAWCLAIARAGLAAHLHDSWWHGINYHRRSLTLKFVDRANPSARQSGLQLEDLGFVWRDDEDVGQS
jgi:hypothetical protein